MLTNQKRLLIGCNGANPPAARQEDPGRDEQAQCNAKPLNTLYLEPV